VTLGEMLVKPTMKLSDLSASIKKNQNYRFISINSKALDSNIVISVVVKTSKIG